MVIEGIGDFYFKRSNGERVLLGESITEQQAMVLMNDFLKKHNYKSYYTRTYMVNNKVHYDVGSWTEEFIFVIKESDDSCSTN